MNIAVIGATGSTGLNFVSQALEKGHHITALVRSPEKMTFTHANLRVIKGDALNKTDVAQAVQGQDVVFIALGTGETPVKSSIRRDGTQTVVDVLEESGEKPLVLVLSSLGVGESKKQMPFYIRWPVMVILRHPFADHNQQEAIIKASSLPYTILRPTSMDDEPGIGQAIATKAPKTVHAQPAIAREDVARFALNTIEQGKYVQEAVTLTHAGN